MAFTTRGKGRMNAFRRREKARKIYTKTTTGMGEKCASVGYKVHAGIPWRRNGKMRVHAVQTTSGGNGNEFSARRRQRGCATAEDTTKTERRMERNNALVCRAHVHTNHISVGDAHGRMQPALRRRSSRVIRARSSGEGGGSEALEGGRSEEEAVAAIDERGTASSTAPTASGNGASASFGNENGALTASSAGGEHQQQHQRGPINSGWKSVTGPMRDFGFGRKSIWEGGVGIFLVAGVAVGGALVAWTRGGAMSASRTSYTANFSFPAACGIQIGTLVRVRGVGVGSVTGITPNLHEVNVEAKIQTDSVRIPKNALVEANRSGLISESLVDITPRHPIPADDEQLVSPLDVTACEEEGLIVCDGGSIKGEEGVSMDELVKYCTKFAKELDKHDSLAKFMELSESVDKIIDEALPLVDKVRDIVEELAPLMKDVSDGNLLESVETLLESASRAVADFHTYVSSTVTHTHTHTHARARARNDIR